MQKPSVDYRNFRLGKLNTDEFRHILLLLFWPAFGLLFSYVERYYPVEKYYSVHCALDDAIPFCEWFFIPYLFWFVWLVASIAYTFFYDIPAFKKMMYFIIFTYTATIIIYFLFPTCQDLRPPEFERQNLLTQMISGFYQFDTNTNVCPSIHVIGSFAGAFAGHAQESGSMLTGGFPVARFGQGKVDASHAGIATAFAVAERLAHRRVLAAHLEQGLQRD